MIPDLKISHEKWGFKGRSDTHPAVLLMGELCLVWASACESSVGNGIFCGCKISDEGESRDPQSSQLGTRAAPTGTAEPAVSSREALGGKKH